MSLSIDDLDSMRIEFPGQFYELFNNCEQLFERLEKIRDEAYEECLRHVEEAPIFKRATMFSKDGRSIY